MGTRRDALAARREALGFTQQTFAEQLGVELSTVGRWERGTLTPQPWRRPDLAAILKVSLTELDALLSPGTTHVSHATFTRSRRPVVDAPRMNETVLIDRIAAPWDHRASLGRTTLPARVPAHGEVGELVSQVHRWYQAARYAESAGLVPAVTAAVDELVETSPSGTRRAALALRTSLAVAEAKLATKAENAPAARMAAQRAQDTAEEAEDPFGQASATYQVVCALLRTGQREDRTHAEERATSAVEELRGTDPQSLTWRGTLTLITAIIAARRGDRRETASRLDHAEDLALRLGVDGNIGWTAFGPTNVMIHRVSAAVALDDPDGALTVAERIDISGIPSGLRGRQAQFHLDSAWAHSQRAEDPLAVIHLLDAERVAPELVRTKNHSRRVIRTLLARERRRSVPGLRGLALRTGVTA
ncbi:helix-turn-helix domain-containing protein [Actinoalloteichus caeruleus]|uniref:helix-turn-helix domain-containing protein n=1 Tax=Actinoalloteichus cyanogriseus TaxID=2893586 RepID=UPI003BB86A94